MQHIVDLSPNSNSAADLARPASKWRERYRVHPSCDAFPMLDDAELEKLAADIKAPGLREPMTVTPERVLLDGRNRLAAVERAGIEYSDLIVQGEPHNWNETVFLGDEAEQVAFIISKNIHRRHLTKQQQADLIVAAHKAESKPRQVGEVSKGGRGKVDAAKAAMVEIGADLDISKRLIERAMAKADGKTPAPAKKKPDAADAADRLMTQLVESAIAGSKARPKIEKVERIVLLINELSGKHREELDWWFTRARKERGDDVQTFVDEISTAAAADIDRVMPMLKELVFQMSKRQAATLLAELWQHFRDLLDWRDSVAQRSLCQADAGWKVLMRVISWARGGGLTTYRPPERIERLYHVDRSEKIWSDEQVASFMAVAPVTLQRALVLGLETGQRQGDLLVLPWSAYDGTWIRLRQSKTDRAVNIPVTRRLRAVLENTPRISPVILTNGHGRPCTAWLSECLEEGDA
jgi:hypothetical protein